MTDKPTLNEIAGYFDDLQTIVDSAAPSHKAAIAYAAAVREAMSVLERCEKDLIEPEFPPDHIYFAADCKCGGCTLLADIRRLLGAKP